MPEAYGLNALWDSPSLQTVIYADISWNQVGQGWQWCRSGAQGVCGSGMGWRGLCSHLLEQGQIGVGEGKGVSEACVRAVAWVVLTG